MEYVNLGKIAKIKTGKLDANAANKNGKYPFFTCSKDPLTINTYSYDCECVLVAGNGDLNVKYYNGKFDAYQRTYIIEILDKNKYNTKYIYLLLISYINALRSKAIGGVIKYIKLGNLTSLKVPMIDIIEQEKIVKKLFKLDKVINIKALQLKTCNNLIKSQFVEMFGNIENTKYDIYKLSELTNLITDGEHKKPNYMVAGIPFISVVNITTGELKFEDCKFVSEEDACKFNKRCNPEKGDILYTKVGATYGRSAIVDTDKKFTLYVSVCLIKPKRDLINSTFLNYTMKQPYVKLQADKSIKGIGVPDLHLIEIKNFKIILPPIELQNKFADIVKQIDKQKFEFENSLKKLEELKNSLMQEYFG